MLWVVEARQEVARLVALTVSSGGAVLSYEGKGKNEKGYHRLKEMASGLLPM